MGFFFLYLKIYEHICVKNVKLIISIYICCAIYMLNLFEEGARVLSYYILNPFDRHEYSYPNLSPAVIIKERI